MAGRSYKTEAIVLRSFRLGEANPRAFSALARFLDVLDAAPSRAPARPSLDPLALAFQLKLLWLSGYLPHLGSCTECGSEGPVVGYSPRAGGAVCRNCAAEALTLSPPGIAAIDRLLRRPLAEAGAAPPPPPRPRRGPLGVTARVEIPGG